MVINKLGIVVSELQSPAFQTIDNWHHSCVSFLSKTSNFLLNGEWCFLLPYFADILLFQNKRAKSVCADNNDTSWNPRITLVRVCNLLT